MMKRRNFLKAIGLGALVAPAVVMAKSEGKTTHITSDQWRHVPELDCSIWFHQSEATQLINVYQDKDFKVFACNPVIVTADGGLPHDIYVKRGSFSMAVYNGLGEPVSHRNIENTLFPFHIRKQCISKATAKRLKLIK